MSIVSYIKHLLYPIQNTSVGFYESTQIYEVSFSVEVYNKSNEAQSVTILLPTPLTSRYQTKKSDVLFFPEGCFHGTDSLYNNAYVWWRIKVPPQKTEFVRESFTIEVRPQKTNLDAIYVTTSDYAALDPILRARYVCANAFLVPTDLRIQEMVKKIIGSETKLKTILSLLNEYVISRLTYGNPISGLYTTADALEKDKVDCGGFDTLLGSLLLSAGIPVRIVSGFFAGYPENSMHAWLEALLPDGIWMPLDPSIEKLRREGNTKKSGKLGFVGSDRIGFSVGCDIPIVVDGQEMRVDILQNPIVVSSPGKESNISLRTVFATSRA